MKRLQVLPNKPPIVMVVSFGVINVFYVSPNESTAEEPREPGPCRRHIISYDTPPAEDYNGRCIIVAPAATECVCVSGVYTGLLQWGHVCRDLFFVLKRLVFMY